MRTRTLVLTSGLALSCIALLLGFAWNWDFRPFPSKRAVDGIVGRLRDEPSSARRAELVGDLIRRLEATELPLTRSGSDEIVTYAICELSSLYLQNHDEVLVGAIDVTHISTSVTFDYQICEFYKYVYRDPSFVKRCRANPDAQKAFLRSINGYVGLTETDAQFVLGK